MRDVLVCTVDNDETYLKRPRTEEFGVVKTELATAGIRD
jgi:hypothetical protein